jgi:hypothetical protein
MPLQFQSDIQGENVMMLEKAFLDSVVLNADTITTALREIQPESLLAAIPDGYALTPSVSPVIIKTIEIATPYITPHIPAK